MTIKPALLDMVVEYADGKLEDSFGTEHPLILFCEQLQLQLSVYVTEKQICGFNDSNYSHMKRVAQKLRVGKHIKGSLVALTLASVNTKVLEDDYSGDDFYADWLHYELMPGLLEKLAEYAGEELKDESLKVKVDEAIQEYSIGVGI